MPSSDRLRRGLRRLVRTLPGLVPALLLGGLAVLGLAIARGARLEPADMAFIHGAEVSSLDPHVVTGVPEGRVLRAVFEGLCVLHPRTLEPLPGVAERWEVSEDGLEWTFQLRRGARWSNGEELTAHDFVWSWERLLNPATGAPYAYLLWSVEGGEAYTTDVGPDGTPARSFESVGIAALDRYTLRVRLVQPTPYFLALTAFYSLFPVNRTNVETAQERWPETWQVEWVRPENLVTNGPWRVGFRRINDRIRLVKSETYWDADNVAFETIDCLSIEHLVTGLNLYLTGGHAWVDKLPPNLVPELLPREDLDPEPYFGSYFYRVNVTRPPLDDPRVRRALALTIPRTAICEKVTKAGERPTRSFVPPGVPGWERAACGAEDPELARRLLAEAGFGPGGREMRTLEIHYNTQEMHRDIAEVIADAWRRELGLDVRLSNQEWKVYLDTQQRLGFDVSRSAWIGDYLDPATFLDMFVTGGENNRTGWSSARYDELIAEAKAEPDVARRLALFHAAETILMDELPILPIYEYVTRNLVNPRLGGFHENALDTHYPKFWYWKSDAELAADRAALPEGTVIAPAPGPREGLYSPAARRARAAGAAGGAEPERAR